MVVIEGAIEVRINGGGLVVVIEGAIEVLMEVD